MDACLAYFDQEMCSGRMFGLFSLGKCTCLTNQEVEPHFIRIGHFRMFPSLTHSIHNQVPSDRRLYCSCTTWTYINAIWTRLHRCIHLYNAFTTFLAVLPVFPRLDHSYHSQLPSTRSQYCQCNPWASHSRPPGRYSRYNPSYNDISCFWLIFSISL